MAAAKLEASEIQEIFRVKNTEKRKALLARTLNFPEFEEDDDLKSSILLDIYHEALSFAVNEGLPWHKVNMIFEIIRKTLMNIAGNTLPEVIQLFRQDVEVCSSLFTEASLKSLVDYSFMTLFQHYKLHRFVLTCDRAEERTKIAKAIEPPTDLVPLTDGIPKLVWDEKQKLKEVDEMEERQRMERHAHYQQLLEEASKHLEIPFEELSVEEQNVNKDKVCNIVKTVANAQANITETMLQETLDEIKDTLEFQHMRANIMAEYETSESKSTGRKSTSGKTKKK